MLVILVGRVRAFAAGGIQWQSSPPAPAPQIRQCYPSGFSLKSSPAEHRHDGVEAVSNGVNAFREPTQKNAERRLTIIIVLLMIFLVGIALLCRAYSIGATDPGAARYQSIFSQLTAAVMGRGWFYYVTIASILAAFALSANTSYADFRVSPAPLRCTTISRTSS